MRSGSTDLARANAAAPSTSQLPNLWSECEVQERPAAPGFTYGPIGELITLEMDDKGKVARVCTPNFYWLPIE
jgi:hypothetical protein